MGENLFLEKSLEESGVSSWIKKDETTVESFKMLSLTCSNNEFLPAEKDSLHK
jgi:hypothetical protein